MEKIEMDFSKHNPDNLSEALSEIGELTSVVQQLVDAHNELLKHHERAEKY